METVSLSGTRPLAEAEALAAARRFLSARVPASVGAYQPNTRTLSDDVHAQLTRLCDEMERYSGTPAPAPASQRGPAAANGGAPAEKPKEKKHKKHKADK